MERPCPQCKGTGKVFISKPLEAFGYRVATFRREKGLQQADIAKVMHMSRTSIANIELGLQNLPIHKVYMLAEALGVDVKDLI